MKDRVQILLTFALSCSSLAAQENPFVGTWRENCDKSASTTGRCSQQSVRIEDAGGGSVKISDESTTRSGRKQQSSGVHRLDGSDVHVTGTEPEFIQSIRRISSNVWERIAKRPGDIRHGYWTVSRDGKTLIINGFGAIEGKEYYFQRVFDRE